MIMHKTYESANYPSSFGTPSSFLLLPTASPVIPIEEDDPEPQKRVYVPASVMEKAILNADRICNETIMTLPPPKIDGPYCERVFDGWSCWNDTASGEVAYSHCPTFITGFDPSRFAFRECMEDGKWFTHPETNKPWSNYTTCVDLEDLALRQKVINVYIGGYFVSLVALLMSLCIFFYFRNLRCARINIHKNLFVSFITNNLMWIIWLNLIEDYRVFVRNGVGCQIFHVLIQYFLTSNYLWMFCEGFYLHTVLVIAFVDEERIMRWLYVIGWGIPLFLTLIYAVIRGSMEMERMHCWIHESHCRLILTVPICISMVANLIFLINIVKVLVTKLRAVNAINNVDTNQTRKAVRATIILIPLLGLHYLIMPFRPEAGTPGEDIFEMVSAVVTSLQGLCVALLFCFFNGEVLGIIRKKLSQSSGGWISRNNYSQAATSISMVTHHSLPGTPETREHIKMQPV